MARGLESRLQPDSRLSAKPPEGSVPLTDDRATYNSANSAGRLQIRRLEPFGEPAIARGQQFSGGLGFALDTPQPRQAHGCAQLQHLRLLLAGCRQGLHGSALRRSAPSSPAAQDSSPAQPVQLGQPVGVAAAWTQSPGLRLAPRRPTSSFVRLERGFGLQAPAEKGRNVRLPVARQAAAPSRSSANPCTHSPRSAQRPPVERAGQALPKGLGRRIGSSGCLPAAKRRAASPSRRMHALLASTHWAMTWLVGCTMAWASRLKLLNPRERLRRVSQQP